MGTFNQHVHVGYSYKNLDLLLCPYDPNHKIKPNEYIHVAKCERQHYENYGQKKQNDWVNNEKRTEMELIPFSVNIPEAKTEVNGCYAKINDKKNERSDKDDRNGYVLINGEEVVVAANPFLKSVTFKEDYTFFPPKSPSKSDDEEICIPKAKTEVNGFSDEMKNDKNESKTKNEQVWEEEVWEATEPPFSLRPEVFNKDYTWSPLKTKPKVKIDEEIEKIGRGFVDVMTLSKMSKKERQQLNAKLVDIAKLRKQRKMEALNQLLLLDSNSKTNENVVIRQPHAASLAICNHKLDREAKVEAFREERMRKKLPEKLPRFSNQLTK